MSVFVGFAEAKAGDPCAHSFKPVIHFPKGSAGIQEFVRANNSNYSLFQQIDLKDIDGFREVPNDGLMNLATYRGKLWGEEVFLKKLDANGAQEGLWLSYLNSLGIGVRFLGVTKIGDHYALVLEYVPGVNSKAAWLAAETRNPKSIPNGFYLTGPMIIEMKRQIAIVYQAGFFDKDPQFLLSKDRVVLFDPMGMTSHESHWKSVSLDDSNAIIDRYVRTWIDAGRFR